MKALFAATRAASLFAAASLATAASASAEGLSPSPGQPSPDERQAAPANGRITAGIAIRELRKLGLQPELAASDDGTPRVTFGVDGYRWAIICYGCAAAERPDERPCTSLQFFSGYTMEKPIPLITINKWNTEKRFARAYTFVSSDGKPGARIEVDVFFAVPGPDPGVSFRAYYDIMKIQAAEFRKRINFK
jgi:hypothetical protein